MKQPGYTHTHTHRLRERERFCGIYLCVVEQKRPSSCPDTSLDLDVFYSCHHCNKILGCTEVVRCISGHHLPKYTYRICDTGSSIHPWPRIFYPLEQPCNESGICACLIFFFFLNERTPLLISMH